MQFKKWFARSKVVDKNGKPLVVYHGSSADFTIFDHRFAYRNGAAEGRGFYFTSDKSKAEGYKTDNGKLFEVYLRLQKPLDPDKLTITKAEVEKIIRSIDTDGMYVADYAEDDRGYPGKIWHNKAVKSTVNAIYDSSDNNADIVAEIYSVFGQGDALVKITEATGYDVRLSLRGGVAVLYFALVMLIFRKNSCRDPPAEKVPVYGKRSVWNRKPFLFLFMKLVQQFILFPERKFDLTDCLGNGSSMIHCKTGRVQGIPSSAKHFFLPDLNKSLCKKRQKKPVTLSGQPVLEILQRIRTYSALASMVASAAAGAASFTSWIITNLEPSPILWPR